MRLFLIVTVTWALSGCSAPSISLDGRACGPDAECSDGYACNPISTRCSRVLRLPCEETGSCSEAIATADACPTVDAFVACESGVRTCQSDLTWSPCIQLDDVRSGEVCDGQDNDGDGLVDEAGAAGCENYFADGDNDGFGDSARFECLCRARGELRVTVGDDCNDGDEDVWASCESCKDADGDGAFGGCDAYVVRDRDCSDSDPDNTSSCSTCVDEDEDGFFVGCDRYVVRRVDCNDADTNNWDACDQCVDTDDDGAFSGCNRYQTLTRDCDNNTNPNTTASCGTCRDMDGDGAFSGCDRYVTVAQDCDDDPNTCGALCAPGAVEWCNATDNDCDGRPDWMTGAPADCTQVVVPSFLGAVDICRGAADVVLTSGVTFNTNSGAGVAGFSETEIVAQVGAPGIRVVFVQSLRVQAGATLTVSGSNALAIVACDSIDVLGTIDVSARGDTGGPGGWSESAGPGAGGAGQQVQDDDPDQEQASGAGGGGHCGQGGRGGKAIDTHGNAPDEPPRGAGGASYSSSSLLRGGSGGGRAAPAGATTRRGGGGGGALHLVAGQRILVSGTLEANGAGGFSPGANPRASTSGSGGGAGGQIVLEAPLVVVPDGGALAANGGGGSGGQRSGSFVRSDGENGAVGDVRARGGVVDDESAGGAGGAGGAGSVTEGANGENDRAKESDVKGGGGGGAVGTIRIAGEVRNISEQADARSPDLGTCSTEEAIESREISP